MRHLTIGTAGHVDHGKTTLIRALTGIDTDRLDEEKRRGLSIELGFAYFDLPNGQRVGIVDVPGHERFLDTMLAGAHGIDLILLVVSAREGPQPQTLEHLQILDLLGVSEGILVLTMADLVDEETIAIAQEEAQELLEGTTLEGIPTVVVDSVSGRGLDELRRRLVEASQRLLDAPPDQGLPRLPIDRVFSLPGFGLIVTGTLRGGPLEVGQSVRIVPGEHLARIRSLQVHHRSQERAEARQRVALNLVGVRREEVRRGDLVVSAELTRLTDRIDVFLRVLEDYPRLVEDHHRVRLFHGTWSGFGRVVLLDPEHREGLLPGAAGYVQLRLEEPRLILRGDRFVLRDDSVRHTLGGGEVVDPFAPRHRRFVSPVSPRLEALHRRSDESVLGTLLGHSETQFLPVELLPYYFPNRTDWNSLLEGSSVVRLGAWIVDADAVTTLSDAIVARLAEHHRQHPLALGLLPAELRNQVAPTVDAEAFSALMEHLQGRGTIVLDQGYVRLPDHRIRFTGRAAVLREQLLEQLQAAGLSAPSPEQMAEELGATPEEVLEVLRALRFQGEVDHIAEDYWLATKTVQQVCEQLQRHFQEQETLEIAEFRALTSTTRKYAVPFLEYCDRQGWTQRVGNVRRARPALWTQAKREEEA